MKTDEFKITYDLTYKDVIDILKIIDDSTCRELHLELGDLKLDLIKGDQNDQAAAVVAPAPAFPGIQAPVETPAQAPCPAKQAVEEWPGIPVRSPLAGMFYCAPAPGAPPFVQVGDQVKAGDQVAIVEVMKLMNSISAPRNGVISRVLVENETSVAMGQVLMLMEPDLPEGTAAVGGSE